MRFVDDTIKPGVAYEYQVQRTARDIVDLGYWIAGVEVEAKAFRGTAHLVVEQTLLEGIDRWLTRFVRDPHRRWLGSQAL